MKKLMLLFISLTFILACTEKKMPAEAVLAPNATEIIDTTTTAVAQVIDTVPTLVEEPKKDVTENDSINFEKYYVDAQEISDKAPLDFSSYPNAKLFITRITDGYNDGTSIDFAGHYIATAFGCGAGCIMGFMVDVRDGKIYDLPLGEENSCFWSLDRSICKPDSRLFISAICKENEESKTPNYIAYTWNEEKKTFEKIDSKEFLFKK